MQKLALEFVGKCLAIISIDSQIVQFLTCEVIPKVFLSSWILLKEIRPQHEFPLFCLTFYLIGA